MIHFLHTNDLHGKLIPAKADFIRALRRPETIHIDSGDCIKAGNLAIPLGVDPAWGLLQRAGCDIGTLGNRETHVLESAFRKKLEGASHPLVCANCRLKSGLPFLPPHLILERDGARIGLFGVMVPMVTEKMSTAPLSAFLWDAPLEIAGAQVAELRPQVDVLIAITHIGFRHDQALLEKCPEIDLIFGGHSHTIIETPERILQGGSHGRFVGSYEFEPSTGLVSAQLIELPA